MLFFHECIHLVASIIAAYLTYLITGSNLELALIFAIVGGFLVDGDHILDYWLTFGFRFKLGHFLKGRQFKVSNRIIVLLHSYELALGLGIVGVITPEAQWKTIFLALSLGLFSHLISDTYLNHIRLPGSMLLYRIYHQFRAEKITRRK